MISEYTLRVFCWSFISGAAFCLFVLWLFKKSNSKSNMEIVEQKLVKEPTNKMWVFAAACLDNTDGHRRYFMQSLDWIGESVSLLWKEIDEQLYNSLSA